jgi:hypothetical protein
MSARHTAVRSFRSGRVRIVLGTSAVGAALALGGSVTAHAVTGEAAVSADTAQTHAASSAASTSAAKHAKPYVSGSETPAVKASVKTGTARKHASPVAQTTASPVAQTTASPLPGGTVPAGSVG